MPLTIKDALRLAQKDSEFANELVSSPEAMKEQFSLSDKQIEQLKALGTAAKSAKLTGHLGQALDYD